MPANDGTNLSDSALSLPGLGRHAVAVLGRIPDRLRDKRFWQVQALVFLATSLHYGIEIMGLTRPENTVHDLTITFYIVPLLYAALSFGWEGALMTALWGAVLTSPSIWIWHHNGLHWASELAQLGITMAVGIVVAWRVDLESRQREIAERTTAGLRLLNQIGDDLSHTLEAERSLALVVSRLRAALQLDSVVLWLEPDFPGDHPTVIQEGASSDSLVAAANAFGRSVSPGAIEVPEQDGMALVPLVAESGVLGCLAASAPAGTLFGAEQAELLATVGHEVAVAVENARLYRERQESLETYVRQVTQAHEDERLRMARELHDDMAQELIHLVRKLEQFAANADPVGAGHAEEGLAISRNILRSVRRFSRDLRPAVLDDLGLVPAIEMVVEEADKLLSDGARLQVSGQPRRLSQPTEVALFRIAQEALRNVEKHAEATSATVELRFASDEVSVAVADNGIGFAPPVSVPELARLGKLGILGMKERAELVGGSFELQAEAGKGTRVVARVAEMSIPQVGPETAAGLLSPT
jgi:signal transduction histidine kinase